MTPSVRSRASSLALLLVLLLLLAAYGFAQAYTLFTHNLARSSEWTSTKTSLARPVPGTMAFIHDNQSLAHGFLNLHAWFGMQEVMHHPLSEPLKFLEWDFMVGDRGYLIVHLLASDGGHYALRLSANETYPSAFLKISDLGSFEIYEPLPVIRVTPNQIHRATLTFENDVANLQLNRRSVVPLPFSDVQQFGFRGSIDVSVMEAIRYTTMDGTTTTHYFSGQQQRWIAFTVIFIFLVFLTISLYFLAARIRHRAYPPLLFFFVMGAFVCAFSACSLWFYAHKVSGTYPDISEARMTEEAQFRMGTIEQTQQRLANLRQASPTNQTKPVVRVFLVGGSQTWGQGAAQEEDIIANQLCQSLSTQNPSHTFRCINAAAPGATVTSLFPLLEEAVKSIPPDWIVLNVSSNDMSTEPDVFEAHVQKFITLAQQHQSQILLVQEAHAPEAVPATLVKKHEILAELAEEFNLPLVPMQQLLTNDANQGFLWWDMVHLTSFGQHRAAQHLSRPILSELTRYQRAIK